MINKPSKQLSEKQQAIVALNTYPQYLRAGAGTGKTEVLIQKILHIISSDETVNLSNFGIITFTNKATEEMKSRLSDELYRHWLNTSFELKDNIREQLDCVNMIDIGSEK